MSLAALDMALSVATAYHCPSLKEELYLAKSLAKTEAFVKKVVIVLFWLSKLSNISQLRIFILLTLLATYSATQTDSNH